MAGFVVMLGVRANEVCPSAWTEARQLAERCVESETRDELRQDVAVTAAHIGKFTEALEIATQLPPGRRAMILLAVAADLPTSRRREAEQLTVDAQTAKSATHDWRKARIARLLAVGHARLDHFEAAEALAQTVPDAEEKAFALQDVVAELCRSGVVAKARELAGAIEDNRRYGTYRQKTAALASTARLLHARGNPEDATTMLAQAELLLPRKPGWSDGIAFVALAEAAYACDQKEKSRELLTRAEILAQSIAGPWKTTELARIARAWNACGDAQRGHERLIEASAFLTTLAPLERADESLPLARAWLDAREPAKAQSTLLATLTEADHAQNKESWQKPRVHALLAWAELFDGESVSTK